MRYAYSALALASVAWAADVAPEAMPTPAITAPGYPLAGCAESYNGAFGIQNVILPGTSGSRKRTPPSEGVGHALYLTLSGGILRDENARFGYIASNQQLQFDNPIQAGGIYTEGWTACANNTLALGGSTVFFQCQSGNFYNIYNTEAGANCIPINLEVIAEPGVTVSSISGASVDYQPYIASSTATSAAVTSAPAVTTSASVVVPPASVITSASAVYTGAAEAVAVQGSFFAAAAGAAAMALF